MTKNERALVESAFDALDEIDIALAAFALHGGTDRPEIRDAAWRVVRAAGTVRSVLREAVVPIPPATGWRIGWHIARWVARRV